MAKLPVASIVGGDTLIGRELNDLLSDTALIPDVRLVSSTPGSVEMVLGEEDDEAAVLSPLVAESLADSDVIFLAGPPETCRQALELIGSASPVIIDVTGALEESPRARLRAPAIEKEEDLPHDTIHVIAHPASIALALFYGRISPKYPIARAVIQVFEPASERGQRGVTELQKQTVNLLSFKSMPKEVFDSQLGFNMLAAYGSEAPETLASFEQRMERDLATLLAKTGMGPMPSLRLIQAPVFHGYGMSIWMEFEQNPGIEVLRHVLSDSDVDVRGDDETPPDNVGIAGQGGIAVGNVRVDRNNAKACWFWLVADNLRLPAASAVAVAREFV
jgi:aspartate-semialdehyde dehydrogenase